MRVWPDLLPNERLLNGSQVLQRPQHEMGIFATANVLAERAELLGEREEDLILVVELVLEERDELLARPLGPEGEGDRREPADGGQAE